MSELPDLESVVTPAFVVDRRKLIRNVAEMAARAEAAGVALYPHAKTHKCVEIADLQRVHGAAGLTVATVREAETFVDAGHDNILVAYPPVGRWRLERLTDLARRARIRVVLDSAAALEALDEACRAAGVTIPFLWEVDCGVARCGTIPGEPTVRALEAAVAGTESADFDGVMTFAGHAYGARDLAQLRLIADRECEAVLETAEALEATGIPTRTLSIGTTPTAMQLGSADGATEVRPGNYVFFDATQVALGLVGPERCAASVLATVISRPDRRRAILDCGSKALAREQLTQRTTGFGFAIDRPELVVEGLFEEHAILTADEGVDLVPGGRVRIVPNHACATTILHERMLVVEGDDVVDVWKVHARGWLSA